MSRKRSHYRPRRVSAPMLVNRGIQSLDIDTQELMLVAAFAGGYATRKDYDNLVEMRNVLTLASAYKDDASATNITEAMRIPLANLRERYARTGHLGVTGDELQLIRVFVDFYRDFWLRQPVSTYERACDELANVERK